jgi:hypothetical protein
MRKLLLALALAAEPAGCYEMAHADTVTIGYFDPAAGMSGIQVLGTSAGTSPIVQLLGNPILPTGPTGFGFDQILAMVIPPGGNSLSGGIPGAVNPTFEFMFNDGFAPPQGGTAYLYASWTGVLTGNPLITLPTVWGTIETPPANPGYTVTTQVLVCNTPNPFCGPFVGGISSFAGQDQFSNGLRIDDITLTALLPGEPFKITEVFVFQGGTHPPFAQGDVGALIETTPISVPAPIVGTGPAAGLAGLFLLWLRKRRRRRCEDDAL